MRTSLKAIDDPVESLDMQSGDNSSLDYLRYGRPDEESNKTLELILCAAEQEFYLHGFHGTTTRKITQRAGVTVANIYYYYASKEELLMDIMTRFMNWSLAKNTDVVTSAGKDPVKQLAALVASHVTQHATHMVPSFVVNNEVRSLNDEFRTQIIGQRDQIQRLFDTALLEGHQTGDFTTQFPLEASRAIVTMSTAVAAWYRPDGPLSPDEVATRYVELALNMAGHKA